MGEKITKMDRQPIISAKDVEITFSLRGKKLNAIRKCSLDLYDGETLAIVGESGSGKSVFTKTFVGMLDVNGKITGGSIMYEGRDMTKFTEKDWLGVRGKKIAMVMQDPMTSLNPLKKIGKQIQESIEHHQGLKGEAAKKAAIEMLAKVGIPDPERRYEQYPHEFSGGMRQRVVIAIAAACRPQVLICDEPTTALDVTIQAQILQLIRDLQKELGMSVIYITHDLGVVANVADRVAVMYAGQIVEYGTVEEIFYDAWHPYTWALLQALPQLGTKGEAAKKAAIEMLAKVGIPDPERRYEQYPHEFSGGMRQRVVIAIAAACRPQILICDEPTTALDVTIQAQILQLIRDLQKELGMSVIYITHDLGVVANVADRVAVMYAGQIVEYGTVEEIFYDAWHPYTWALLQALPQLGTKGEALPTIDGTPPNLFNEIKGDAFAPRNKHALAIDFVAEPPFFQVSETHAAKTWYLDPRAPKMERPHSIQNLREKMGKMGGSNLNG